MSSVVPPILNDVYTCNISLSAETTLKLLKEAGNAYHTEINDLLLTALARAVKRWTNESDVLITLEGHGREPLPEVNTSRTLGWFTSTFPLSLAITQTEISDQIKSVKEQLRAIPDKGLSYGALRYIAKADLPEIHPNILFNYLGQWDKVTSPEMPFKFADESSGLSSSLGNRMSHAISINGHVSKQCLVISIDCAKNEEASVQQFANYYEESLCEVITHCCSEGVGGHTPP